MRKSGITWPNKANASAKVNPNLGEWGQTLISDYVFICHIISGGYEAHGIGKKKIKIKGFLD